MPEKIKTPSDYRLYELRLLTAWEISYLCAGYYPDEEKRRNEIENIQRTKEELEGRKNLPSIETDASPEPVQAWYRLFRERLYQWANALQRDARANLPPPQQPLDRAGTEEKAAYEQTFQFLLGLDTEKLLLTHTLTYKQWQDVFADWKANGKELPQNQFFNPELRETEIQNAPVNTVPSSSGASTFPTAPGTTWEDITIKFIDGHTVSIKAGSQSNRYSYEAMGMNNRKSSKPNKQWELLIKLAENHGEATFKSDSKLKATKKNLSKGLKTFFNLKDDPFKYQKTKYIAIFKIHPEK